LIRPAPVTDVLRVTNVTGAGSIQEKYFIVLAGLLQKNLEVLTDIKVALSQSSPTGKEGSGASSGEVAAGPSRSNFNPSQKRRL